MKDATTVKPTSPTLPERAREMLERGEPLRTLELLDASAQASPEVQNLRGVCLMRCGRHEQAVKLFRRLVFPGDAFAIPHDTPTAWRVNYVTALLLVDNVTIALGLLREIPDRQHEGVRALGAAVRAWRNSLPWWRRVLLHVGAYPERSFQLHSPPGCL